MQQSNKAGSELCASAEAAHAALLKVKADGANVQDIFSVTGQKRLNTVDKFLNGKR